MIGNMTNSGQHRTWILVTLAFVIVLGVVATQSAQARSFTDLYNFTGGSDGAYPYAGLVRDSGGNLYGTTGSGGSSGFGVVFKLSKNGTETVLHSFVGGLSDGQYPYGTLAMDAEGNLYGTAAGGGGTGCGGFGCGVVFEVNMSGTETVLHSFTGGSDGEYPYAELVRDAKGNLYGTAAGGGGTGCGGFGCGVAFKVNKKGTETVLYSFTGGPTDGCYPHGSLLMDTKGNLYGTTDECGTSDLGTVFKVSKTGEETVLHSFAGGTTDGDYPFYAGLLMDTEGNLYGNTYYGGASNEGVVYKLSKKGTLTVLHSFAGGTTDGCYPYGTPAMDTRGNLYGTTEHCGASSYGIVWKVSNKGKGTVLHSFAGGASDGEYPVAGVILDAKDNPYGDTAGGGASDLGTVYELKQKGTITLLHSFAGSDGAYPAGSLIWDAKGNLYGTASQGGSDDYGTVWKLTP